MITSNLKGLPFPGDTPLTEGNEAGLHNPSLVRVAKVVTIEKVLIRKKLGSAHAVDCKLIRDEFQHVFRTFI